MKAVCTLFLCTLSCLPLTADEAYDLVIYGGASAGVMAAVQAKKMGVSVVVVGPDVHLGGLSSGGLSWTDSGKKKVIGGLSREFYHQVHRHYENPESWRWQKPEQYGKRGVGDEADKGKPTRWTFEPHVAEKIFENLVKEHRIKVHRDEFLNRKSGVAKDGTTIRSIKMLSGLTLNGRAFIDATYEGDLMAAAGASFTVGRESNSTFGETLNGVQTERARSHQFDYPVSAYKVKGDPSSGLLARVSDEKPGPDGSGDSKVQAYCFRTCMTNHPDNRVPFPKPERCYAFLFHRVRLPNCHRAILSGFPHCDRFFLPLGSY